MRALRWFLFCYAAALLLLAPHLSLWLDEVLTLTGAVQPDLASLMENLRKQQGATPLAFLIPHWTIELFGLSPLTARLPSILASVASLPPLYLIGKRIGLPQPAFPVAVFAVWPLQVRYALEARPYALALCLGLWLSLAFLKKSRWPLYVLLVILMGLTHPYSLVIPAAHLVWSLVRDRSRAILPAAALLLAGLALLPWYAHFSAGWSAQSTEQQLGMWNPRAVLVFFREISGSGYIGTAILAAGIAWGWSKPLEYRPLWAISALLPVIAVPAANVAFDYFFAIRQLIYVLPAAAILFCVSSRRRERFQEFRSPGPYGTGLHVSYDPVPSGRGTVYAYSENALVFGFVIVSLYSNVVWLTRPREDWSAASNLIAAEVSKGACVQFVGDSQKLFAFFRPELSTQLCTGAPRVVLAGSTYEPTQAASQAALIADGFHKQSTQSFVAPIVEVYSR